MKRRLIWSVLLIVIASAVFTPVALAAEQYSLGRITADDSLNLREKATTDSDVIAKIPGGSQVLIISSYGHFFKVKYDGNVGYVSDEYAVKLKHWVGYATDEINLRASASVSSKKLGTIEAGESLYIYASNGDFYLAVYGDTKCYVSKNYISKKKGSVVSAADESESGEEFDPDSNEFYIEDPPDFTDEELYMAAQLIYSEGAKQTSLSYWVMACVIYNRVVSKSFPDTVYEVTFQNNQFSYPDNDPDKFLELVPSDAAVEAVIKVFVEGKLIIPPDVLYFKSASLSKSWGKRVYYCTIGGNMYYE